MVVRWRLLALLGCALCSGVAADRACATCSTSALVTVEDDARFTAPPPCGPRRLRRSFVHARNKIAMAAARAARVCARGAVPRTTNAHAALARLETKLATVGLDDQCRAVYEGALPRLVAALDDAVTGTTTTSTTITASTTSLTTAPPGATSTTTVPGAPTTTVPGTPTTTLPGTPTTTLPGTPTTTLPAKCATVQLEVDKGDCLSVTSVPARFVHCGADCDVRTFTVPGTGTIKLEGTPGPGDDGVTFDTDCDDDGTLVLDDATPPDCSLSCDCSSGF